MYSVKMLNIILTRKYALFEQETKRTDFFLTPFSKNTILEDMIILGRIILFE